MKRLIDTKLSGVLFTALLGATITLAPLHAHVESDCAGSDMSYMRMVGVFAQSGGDPVGEGRECCNRNYQADRTPADRSSDSPPASDHQAPGGDGDRCPCCTEAAIPLIPWFVPHDSSSFTLAIRSPAPVNPLRPDSPDLDSLLRPPIP
ncbi:MAG: hypothetical protein OER86_04805 [Phycisphaerae bacterium]|nr:hypothetical protein [Phycisphaerae bacterium]